MIFNPLFLNQGIFEMQNMPVMSPRDIEIFSQSNQRSSPVQTPGVELLEIQNSIFDDKLSREEQDEVMHRLRSKKIHKEATQNQETVLTRPPQLKIEKSQSCGSAKRKRWTRDDDAKITELYQQHGTKWTLIAQIMGTATGKQIRERY